ncbi:hypothetical protein KG104_06370 [Arthrobacter sunyaminii]|uniref:DUF4157 domain-containing protein n=1 Tax=Arthrobacter sunyaminii TaxID=2816859 RepID=A0A975S7P9_9MICC|nr:hypothetical protein [Arthrobacter sunyaminii]MBO0908385.1 hypothetical protein [Arthrobacter sunyaminii]QWQ37365.1 hypothetical protein KG104_06370 [Arthrobacter sunyaminii]
MTSRPVPVGRRRSYTGRVNLRQLLNIINLTTPAGLLLARAGHCAVKPGPDGLLLAGGWTWPLPKAAAFTVGNVILYRPRAARLFSPGPDGPAPLMRHEARHASQYAGLGLAFLPLYFAAAGLSVLRTGDPASGNVFERLAGLADGGYS